MPKFDRNPEFDIVFIPSVGLVKNQTVTLDTNNPGSLLVFHQAKPDDVITDHAGSIEDIDLKHPNLSILTPKPIPIRTLIEQGLVTLETVQDAIAASEPSITPAPVLPPVKVEPIAPAMMESVVPLTIPTPLPTPVKPHQNLFIKAFNTEGKKKVKSKPRKSFKPIKPLKAIPTFEDLSADTKESKIELVPKKKKSKPAEEVVKDVELPTTEVPPATSEQAPVDPIVAAPDEPSLTSLTSPTSQPSPSVPSQPSRSDLFTDIKE